MADKPPTQDLERQKRVGDALNQAVREIGAFGHAKPVGTTRSSKERRTFEPDLVHALRKGRGLTEVPNDDGAVMRDAWVQAVMLDAADEIERLRAALAVSAVVG